MKHQTPKQFQEGGPAFGAPVAEVFGKGASMFGRSLATMQKESLRFFNERLEDNMKAVEEFGACKSLPDLLAAQQKWFASTTRAYAEEWQRCSELMTDMMRETSEDAAPTRRRPSEPH